jgi:flagellar biosynthesis protein
MKEKDNLRRHAVALSYKENQHTAPIIAAKGSGLIADNIIEKAKESGVPIQEDPSLVELLGKLNIQEQVPEDLYQAVAEVFAFIYRLDKTYGTNKEI